MAKTIAIVNQKGGVGKTTTCVNLSAALTEAGKRVLLCDFDPQANSTSGMGVDKTVSKGIYDALIGETAVADAIVPTKYGDVLPSNKALAGAGIELIAMDRREFLLRDALDQVKDRYDYIFIDCPPSLELLTLNALCAADAILVPVQGGILRAGGAQRPDEHRADRPPVPESPAGAGRRAADHVRRPDQPGPPGGGGSEALLPRQGLRHGDPPERPPQRGAQPRQAHHRL